LLDPPYLWVNVGWVKFASTDFERRSLKLVRSPKRLNAVIRRDADSAYTAFEAMLHANADLRATEPKSLIASKQTN